MSPAELEASGWVEAMGAVVVRTGKPTCGGAELDYFVVDKRLACYASAAPAFLGTAPHVGVALTITRGYRAETMVKMVAPKPLPTAIDEDAVPRAINDRGLWLREKIGELPKPANQEELTSKWKLIISYVEEAVTCLAGVPAQAASAMKGRAKGPVWKSFNAMGNRTRDDPMLSATGRQAKELALQLGALADALAKGSDSVTKLFKRIKSMATDQLPAGANLKLYLEQVRDPGSS